jgi:Ca-activated chloride channel family protein
MKKALIILSAFLLYANITIAHGVAIKDANLGTYLRLATSSQEVTVFDQVATIVSIQVFQNQTGLDASIKYAFPLHEEASATGLRWKIHNIWYSAVFAPSPQDTTLPGGGTPDPDLLAYLGDSPLYFEIPNSIDADSSITVELTYVELLPYDFSIVDFDYPNNYSLIQNNILNQQHLHFILQSQRTIESIDLTSHTGATITNDGNHAEITYDAFETYANQDYHIEFALNSDELGMYGYSTYLPDSLNSCDSIGNGFFTLIVEPDPGDTSQVIQKVFTLIIDRSGSMTGNKMEQAKNAASYIVENLNDGDYFNIVSFDDVVESFQPGHVEYNSSSKEQALAFISALYARNMTDIASAFHTAIEDFSGNDTTMANIIIFFTDGQPTAGLQGTQEILDYIQSQLSYYEVQNLTINTFGIGEDVNQPLLSQIASQNNGLCEFLLNNELQLMITDFFRRINNPVLLNTTMSFDPAVITETYPDPLPNLYLGQQLIISGRYDIPGPVHLTLSGQAFDITRTYEYDVLLSDSLITENMFLTKLWAKRKIDNLYVQYFTYPTGSSAAQEIMNEIIGISVCYNVSSPFTHMSGGGGTPTSIESRENNPENQMSASAYPNPFNSTTTIRFTVENAIHGMIEIQIVDLFGRVIRFMKIAADHSGAYELEWDGRDQQGNDVKSGKYFFRIILPERVVIGTVTRY